MTAGLAYHTLIGQYEGEFDNSMNGELMSRRQPVSVCNAQGATDFPLLINGRWQPALGERVFSVQDPYTEQCWGRVADAAAADVDAAVQAARAAFDDGRWSRLTAATRADRLHRLAALIQAHAQTLAYQQIFENGKLLSEVGPVTASVAADCRFFAGLAETLNGATVPSPRPGFTTFTLREPIGVCAAITPWNTPLGLLGWKLFPALAAGNTMVVKPSEVTPTSTLMLAELLAEADIPDGVVNVVTGGAEAGVALVEHPMVDKVAFTGSTRTGQWIASRVALRSARVSLELGGKSPNIVFADADLDRAVDGIVGGIFAASGQSCMAGSRVLVQSSVFDAVCDRLVAKAQAMTAGDPLDSATDLGPLASVGQLNKVMHYFEIARSEKLRRLCGGDRLEREGFFVAPTVYANVAHDSRLATEEILDLWLC